MQFDLEEEKAQSTDLKFQLQFKTDEEIAEINIVAAKLAKKEPLEEQEQMLIDSFDSDQILDYGR